MRADIVRARLALIWLATGEARAHPSRPILTALAIAVGVALGFAVHLVNGSALTSFEGAVTQVNGAADLQVRAATPLGFPDALYPKIAGLPGVSDASPVVSLDAQAGAVKLSLLGLDILRAAHVTPSLVGALPAGPDQSADALFAPDQLFLSRGALASLHGRIGGKVQLSANGRTALFRIAGTLPGAGDGQALGVIDIAAAQERFGRLGRLDRIDIATLDRAQTEATLRAQLPAGVVVANGQTRAAQGDTLSRAYRVNLDMLALVALLTGGFLVFSAQSLAVARRLQQFALLRTLGLPRHGVIAAVALEGVVIGIVGAGLGLLAGYGLAALALIRFGGDLGAGYFGGGSARLAFQPIAALCFFLLGVAAAALGSILPARAAARAAPAAALRNAGDLIDPRAPVPWRSALVLGTAGAGAALLPPIAGLPWFGFGAMALLLAGGVAAVPWLARTLLKPWTARPPVHVPPLLALRRLAGAPSEAATALCGIVASTALTVAMATMVTSFRGAVGDWLGDVLSADLFARVNSGGFAPDDQARLRQTPGVSAIAFSRQLPLTLRADRPPVVLIARPIGEPGSPPLLLLGRSVPIAPGATPLWVSEPASRLYGWRVGDRVALPLPGARFMVAGIWRDYARQAGALVIRNADYSRLTGDRTRDEAAVTLRAGAVASQVSRALVARVPSPLKGQVEVTRPRELRAYALALFDRSFAITYALEAVAILVGLAGVAATVSGQVVARAREFGMLRHLGVTKGQLLAMLGMEGALLGLVGGVAGVALGLVLAEVLIHVINPQSFNWTMGTILPAGVLIGVPVALIGAASLTAIVAGRRATARSAVLAVREDW